MPAVAQFPLFSVSFERKEIPVDILMPLRVPDEKWRFVDAQGHGHFWDGKDLPTLKWVVTGTEWVGDEYEHDEIDIGEWRCVQCAEIIEPGMKVDYSPRSVPGLVTFTVTIGGESFILTEEQYAKSVEAWADSMRSMR